MTAPPPWFSEETHLRLLLKLDLEVFLVGGVGLHLGTVKGLSRVGRGVSEEIPQSRGDQEPTHLDVVGASFGRLDSKVAIVDA